jgi:phosphatidylglycerol lysyltransferase
VLAHGWNATAYQLINPGIAHWFAPEGDAVVGYVRRTGVHVVAGAPVCALERLPSVTAAFEARVHSAGDRVCYFGAEARLEAHFHGDPSHSRVLLGGQPAWHPADWAAMVARTASVRAQLHRARNKGVRVEEWSPGRAQGHPELERCLREWLATRGLPPLHFLVEPATLERLFDRRIFVARRGDAVVAFLVASPVPGRHGWLIEQFVRGHAAPNGTNDLLVDTAVRAMAAAGAEYVTLGLSPLSRHAGVPRSAEEPLWLRALLVWVRAHGRRFYNFDGLDRFKAKFRPDRWEPIYAIADEPRFAPRMLYAIAAAFTQQSPVIALARGIGRAIGVETRRAMDWLGDR